MENQNEKNKEIPQENVGLIADIERLEKANAEKKALLEREERLITLRIKGGASSVSQEVPQPSIEQKQKQEAIEFWKGSGVDKAIAKHG